MLPHVEWLIRERLLNVTEAIALVKNTCSDLSYKATYLEEEHAADRRDFADAFFWRVYPLIPNLNPKLRNGAMDSVVSECLYSTRSNIGYRPPAYQMNDWVKSGLDYLAMVSSGATSIGRGESYRDDRHTLEYLDRFVSQVLPKDVPYTSMARFMQYMLPQMITKGFLKVENVEELYRRLGDFKIPVHKFYAAYGRLCLELKIKGFSSSRVASATTEVDELAAFIERLDDRDPDIREVKKEYNFMLTVFRKEIGKASPATLAKSHPLPENPIPDLDPSARVTFRPVDGIASPWHGLIKCRDDLDVMWSNSSVYVMREKGKVETVLQVARDPRGYRMENMIYSAVWDGENIWVATMKSGIVVVSPIGERLGSIHTEQGLPPFDEQQLPTYSRGWRQRHHPRPMHLHALEPGRCLAIGRYGVQRRLWFAEISRSGRSKHAAYQVRVVHDATKVPQSEFQPSPSDPATIFRLCWLLEHNSPVHPANRVLLVGRMIYQRTRSYPPLAIDLDSMEVSVYKGRVPYKHVACASKDGIFLFADLGSVKLMKPPDKEDAEWLPRTILEGRRSDLVFQDGKTYYCPGATWYRISSGTWETEKLNGIPVPLQFRFEEYGVSAHYGLVAWNADDHLYQVLIDSKESATGQVSTYPFVPENVRDRHRRAVDAIRRLGGSVDSQWNPGISYRQPAPPWETVVYLSDKWRGGDEGLAHLLDLHHLRRLSIVQAPVTDNGMRYVGQVSGLFSLALVETNVTDRGVEEIKSIPNLTDLRLEGTAGGEELTDACLKRVGQLPRLKKLTICGRRMKDPGLEHLTEHKTIDQLWLYDTGITSAGLAKVRKAIPSLRVFKNGSPVR